MNEQMKELIAKILDIGVKRNQELLSLIDAENYAPDWSKWDALNSEMTRLKDQLFNATLEAYMDEMRHTK